jgi:dTDP-glucose 4,6-dehydratase
MARTRKPSILITGAGGFVGHHFLEHIFAETDWHVIVTDSFRHKGKTDRINEVMAAKPSYRKRLSVITHDLAAPFSDQTIQRMGDIDYIVSFASESHVDRSITDPVTFTRNNVDIALNMLELARIVKPKNFVWISTDEVYGPVTSDDTSGHAEWSPILPSNPYAGSKAAQEAIALSYWRTYGVPLQIINCMNMIGERQDPEKFVPSTIAKVASGGLVSIHGTPGNIGTRVYIHARNLADGVLFLLRNKKPVIFGENSYNGQILRADRYNVVAPDRIDNLTMAHMIADHVGKPLKYELVDFHKTRPGHDPHYALDGSKLNALGWEMPVPFEDSLHRLVKWSLDHPEWLL